MTDNEGYNGNKSYSGLRCSFCGKSEREVDRLIAGPGVYICSDCVDLCNELLDDQGAPDYALAPAKAPADLMTPMELKEALDDYVIGQEAAKKVLAVSVYNHYKRVFSPRLEVEDGVELGKSNILLIGPTGSGKTLLAQTLARLLHVPFAIADATALTEAGYVGEDVENILLRLIQNADYDIARAEQGIIYVDEIDKITRRSDNPSITRDVSGEGVQQALLKILESTIANVPPQGGRKHPHQEFIQLDTSNILFILGGAFDGLNKIIMDRVGKKSIGFGAVIEDIDQTEPDSLLEEIMPEDLLKYGLIPEFIGRVPVIACLQELDQKSLERILTEPKNALLKQYKKLFAFDGVNLEFEQKAISAIAKKSMALKTGARGLRTIMEDMILDLMYEVPSRDDVEGIVITEKTVSGKDKARLVLKKDKKIKKAQ